MRESRREEKAEKQKEKEKSKIIKHPLADYVNLSELQGLVNLFFQNSFKLHVFDLELTPIVIITEALLYHGEPCSFEKLNDFVSTVCFYLSLFLFFFSSFF